MTPGPVDLLRLLEPAVRPAGLPARADPGRPALEARSFESLLDEAKGLTRADLLELVGPAPGDEAPQASEKDRGVSDTCQANPLRHLEACDNASVRRLLERRTGGLGRE
jgi:hypothetical protein